jgi:hypothetical protein
LYLIFLIFILFEEDFVGRQGPKMYCSAGEWQKEGGGGVLNDIGTTNLWDVLLDITGGI